MPGGHTWQRGACMVKGRVCVWLRGCAWQKGGMCGEGGGGMRGKGACVAGEATTAVGGTHPTGMHSLISFYLGTVLSHS